MAIGLLSDLLDRVTDIGRSLDTIRKLPEKPLLEQCQNLLNRKGEASNLALASHILTRYAALNEKDKCAFFIDVCENFGAHNSEALEQAIADWQNDQSDSHARALHFASEPRSQELLRRLNQAPNATAMLVNMRADLLKFTKTNTRLKSLDKDFSHLLNSWFNRGFLELKRIDWHTSASILEKVIAYEAVHEIQSWDDLRRRVDANDRRLYGYFHPALGEEPLIFVEVALTNQKPDAIAPILSEDREPLNANQATTAVFYSISNCQKGLRGISFGNFLIKQVVETLRREFANIETFITLSPIPSFRAWAKSQINKNETKANEESIALIKQLENTETQHQLIDQLENNDKLKALVANYLVVQRSPRGGATDPVARFHLGNGAHLENIHLQADLSKNGLSNAYGCMVNYLYQIKNIEKNHEAYTNNDEVTTSSKVNQLLKTK